jgi:hypothetical protein
VTATGQAPPTPAIEMRPPLWLPAVVRRMLEGNGLEEKGWLERYEREYREHPQDLAVLRRLATDPRMEWVWREFVEGERPANFKRLLPDSLKRFFFIAYDAACHTRHVTTVKQLKVTKRSTSDQHRKQIADSIVAQATQAARTRRRGDKFVTPPLKLRPKGWRPPTLVVWRQEDSNPVRAYVLEVSGLARELFGNISYRTIATVASVALQQQVTERQVKRWTCRLPSTARY